jgi:4-methyl-5(b-hydroxyethyl)-thiazole monophosphate biosynthesis
MSGSSSIVGVRCIATSSSSFGAKRRRRGQRKSTGCVCGFLRNGTTTTTTPLTERRRFRRKAVGDVMTMRSAAAEDEKEKTALVPIANGSEEMEATIIIDVLRRAGVHVTVASCEDDLVCEMSRKVCIRADCLIQEVVVDDGEKNNSRSSFDAIVVPGGMPGAERLAENLRLDALLKRQKEEKKLIAAMCAAPAVVLLGKNLLEEASEATAHPAFDLGEAFAKDKKKRVCYSKASNGRVVITSQGPGTAIEFALELVKELCGEEKRKEVAGPMCVPEDVLMG